MKVSHLLFILGSQAAYAASIGSRAVESDDKQAHAEETSTQSPHGIFRYDRVSVWDKSDLVMKTFEAFSDDSTIGKEPQQLKRRALAPENAFKIIWQCDATTRPEICDAGLKDFTAATRLIAEKLTINEQIVVQAHFKSFCGGVLDANQCEDANILGAAQSVSLFPGAILTSAGQTLNSSNTFLYPQSILKQYPMSAAVKDALGEVDISAEFNADYTWIYENKPFPGYPDGNFSLMNVIIHEVLHGLGFDSAFQLFNSIYPFTSSSIPYIAPILYYTGSKRDPTIRDWMPPMPYDGLLRTVNGRPITDWAYRIYKFFPGESQMSSFIPNFERSGDAFAAARELYQIFTSSAFATITNPVSNTVSNAQIYTPNPYESGSSIAHVDFRTFAQTPDDIMIPQMSPLVNKTWTQIMAGRPEGLFGGNTMGVLKGCGWNLPSGRFVHVTEADGTGSSPRDGAASIISHPSFALIAGVVGIWAMVMI
ncbi:hypothetical protein HDU85_004743 [Gaertneriomyces sp. JEL0708]|nr:hypothetical protein HDU85_004743 [Gaertneriomyces sp. JEL0708]